MKQDELVAVPMFILMGFICDQAGLMERLFKAFRDLFAPLKRRALLGRHRHRDAVRHRCRNRGRDGGAARHHGRADDDPRRLRRAHVGGRDRGRRHARHPDSAVGDAGRDGAGARHLDHRLVRGRVRPGLSAVRHVHRLHADPLSLQSEARSAGAARGAAGIDEDRAVGVPGRPRSGDGADHRHAGCDPRRHHDRGGGRSTRRARRHPSGHPLRQDSRGAVCCRPATARWRPPAWCCCSRSPRTCSARCSRGSARPAG